MDLGGRAGIWSSVELDRAEKLEARAALGPGDNELPEVVEF